MYRKSQNGFVRISETAARKAFFDQPETIVYLCASKIMPQMWDEYLTKLEKSGNFDQQVEKYKEQKCSYKTGKFPAYFVRGRK